MKRVLVVLICLTIFSSFGLAENIDLPNMNVDELLALMREAESALYEQDGLELLYDGIYVVGEDIPVGAYIITSHTSDKKIRIAVGSSDDYSLAYEYYIDEGSQHITLEDGQLLVVQGDGICTTTIRKANSLFTD